MRVAALGLSRAVACMIAVAGLAEIGAPAPAAADDSAAHAIAEKFSARRGRRSRRRGQEGQGRAGAKAAEALRRHAADQRAADEADLQAQARAEAEARRAADQRKAEEQDRIEAERDAARAQAAELAREAEAHRQEELAKAEEARKAEAARLERQVEEQRLADERRQAEEQKRAEAARLAEEAEEKRLAEERRQAEAAEARRGRPPRRGGRAEAARRERRQAEEQKRAEAARLAKEAEEKRIAEERRQAEAAQAALEARRQEEAQRIADKFRLAREAREARARESEQSTRSSLGGPPPAPWDDQLAGDDAAHATEAGLLPARVTVLLVVEPKESKFTGRPRSPNLVLCVGESCYVSGGAGAPAITMPRWQTLGPANTLGRRAGPCNRHPTCVFRSVELTRNTAWIQPISMGFWHHDRLDIRTVSPDRTCEVAGRQLYCAKPIVAHGYRAWIVPEDTARRAGAEALEEAVESGLPLARSASGENVDRESSGPADEIADPALRALARELEALEDLARMQGPPVALDVGALKRHQV